jgi:hypothetical protein
MQGDEVEGEALDEVARIHPVVDRLREQVASATLLELKATAPGYWADRQPEPGSGDADPPPAD